MYMYMRMYMCKGEEGRGGSEGEVGEGGVKEGGEV